MKVRDSIAFRKNPKNMKLKAKIVEPRWSEIFYERQLLNELIIPVQLSVRSSCFPVELVFQTPEIRANRRAELTLT
ncbi:hypothetical protein [Persicitalea jodogahamensis]|uniref:Uncharacterized protein n=1 Tax=Persicitalea jodogahamensis TaxID=402147 RepID=A0A8J3D8C4_9BACT|nr:hypothetical protein [Persicitalea jodogahamensis]GHB87071.1 hypothetical protein GCM10007390_48660 [Persicitalea jodogahamensis]